MGAGLHAHWNSKVSIAYRLWSLDLVEKGGDGLRKFLESKGTKEDSEEGIFAI